MHRRDSGPSDDRVVQRCLGADPTLRASVKPHRKQWGTNVAQPKPFTVFERKGGGVAVRIGRQKPFVSADEVSLNAGLVIVTMTSEGLQISGEGVVRRHGSVIAITP